LFRSNAPRRTSSAVATGRTRGCLGCPSSWEDTQPQARRRAIEPPVPLPAPSRTRPRGSGSRPVGRADDGGLEPVGTGVGDALLEERRPARPIGEALEQHRAPAHRAEQRLLDGLVVVNEIKLGLAPLVEIDLG